MKIIAVITLLLSSSLCEPPAPYAASGWRPDGPAFRLPQEQIRQNSNVQDSYLPPNQKPTNQYGVPEDDLSVQGLPPTQEQTPQFLLSPVSGQQYVGPTFDADVRFLDNSFKQSQVQQDTFKELTERQRELQRPRESSFNDFSGNQSPRQFPDSNNVKNTDRTTPVAPRDSILTDSTTESVNNEETSQPRATSNNEKENVTSVEVLKQRLQKLQPDFVLSPLTQLQANQFTYPLQQLGQLQASIYFQPNGYSQALIQQIQPSYDGPMHFAGLQSILSQRQLLLAQPQNVFQTQGFTPRQPNLFVNQNQPDPDSVSILDQDQTPSQLQSRTQLNQPQSQTKQTNVANPDPKKNAEEENENQNQFVINQPQLYQPQPQVQYQPQQFPQIYQSQEAQYQPQQFPQTYQPQQFLQTYQPQDAQYQPQQTYQPQTYQPQGNQQLLNQQSNHQVDPTNYYQNQQFLLQQQNVPQFTQRSQGQDALQSGLNVNQQGNALGQKPSNPDYDDDAQQQEESDDGTTATAVATAFGARVPPRSFSQYGAPAPNALPDPAQTTVQTDVSEQPTVAEATAAVADERRKNSKLRNRRVRPIFTLDKSGHLVLAQNQQGY